VSADPPEQRHFVIDLGPSEEVDAIYDFHAGCVDDFLWPRSPSEFVKLAEDECLYRVLEVRDGRRYLVGICYVKEGRELEAPQAMRWEFGGIYISEDCRGLGIPTTLGMVAVSNHLVGDYTRNTVRMIAHVHEFNDKPRGLLDRLGFKRVGEEIPPDEVAPKSMRRNERGEVVGHLFEFDRKALSGFADWLQSYDGTTRAKDGRVSRLEIALPLADRYRSEAVEALRQMGA